MESNGPYPTDQHDQKVHTIVIPESTRQSEHVPMELIAEGASFLHKDGIIVLENAVAPSHLETLNTQLSTEALEIAQDPDHHFNFGKQTRNMDQAPPPTRSLMYKDVWCNPFAAAILAAVLGPRPVVHYANGNTALKAPVHGRQPVHSDCDFAHPVYFPFAYVVNVPLVDMQVENGGTEVWVGSHHVSVLEAHVHGDHGRDGDGEEVECEDLLAIRPEVLERRRVHSPPLQVATKRGSLIIRDLRLWHAGMPNLTDEPRVMLAFVVSPAWWQGKGRIVLPVDVKDMVEGWEDELGFAADYVDGQVDHKKLSSDGVDFGSASHILKTHQAELSRWPVYTPRWY
ncbi:hypothetical protein B0A52_03884 [Exophiala mesophila]|uniref:Phytanoyl-CoA dioxygenase n=1 Tax=Exophiala mesophila TaxID=212818 RepID=A0A438N7F8_EXOME|nr:hypothetical protein B0A52_03884 [Exophiala mesophila]